MPRNPTLVPEPFYQVLQARVGDPTTHPPSPPAVSARNWTKYNKSLKDPVRGAGSAQVQIQSYRDRQSGNLARKVRNTFPMCKALIDSLQILIISAKVSFSTVLVFMFFLALYACCLLWGRSQPDTACNTPPACFSISAIACDG